MQILLKQPSAKTQESKASTPLLSIVVPVYNGEAYIEGCLHSIQAALGRLDAQATAQIELIVCDNRSTDRTLTIAQTFEWACPNRIIQPPEFYDNRTLNWAHGLAAAQGTWMMMLHADDLMAADGLVAMGRACREQADNPAIVLIQSRHRTFTDPKIPNRLAPLWPFPALIDGPALDKAVLAFICPFVPFITMRRTAYHAVGGLDSQYELVQDWDLWLRLLRTGNLYYHPHEIGWWRLHKWSPKYTALNAKEHFEFASNLALINPDLPDRTRRFATRVQLAKIKNWLPDANLETVAAQTGKTLPPAAPHDISSLEVQAIFKQMDRRVAFGFYRLRAIGTLSWLGSRWLKSLRSGWRKKAA